MQYIDKKLTIPDTVQAWIDNENPQKWNEISQNGNKIHYETLREQLRQEQKGLCCYCCQILPEKVTIEHLKARKNFPDLTFNYNNLLLSCKPNPQNHDPIQCDKSKGDEELDLTPLMKECDVEIKLNLTGKLEWKTDRAEHAINLLNLNNQDLCKRRKDLLDGLYESILDLDLEFSKEDMMFLINSMNDTTPQTKELYHYISKKIIWIDRL